ncbi:ProQ/FinO family protein [Pseudomonas aeruginosa]|uniref:ProQ/FinO family protein n=1 Tax=Pseudomonas aeruginosa TaxID=287 RepID=UPI0032B5A820
MKLPLLPLEGYFLHTASSVRCARRSVRRIDNADPTSRCGGTGRNPPRRTFFLDKWNKAQARTFFETHFAELFDYEAPRPLKIGIWDDLFAAVKERQLEVSESNLRWGVKIYVRRMKYMTALAAGGNRFGLDGEAVGEISEVDQENARRYLAGMLAQAQKAAERKQAAATSLPDERQDPLSAPAPAPEPEPPADDAPVEEHPTPQAPSRSVLRLKR